MKELDVMADYGITSEPTLKYLSNITHSHNDSSDINEYNHRLSVLQGLCKGDVREFGRAKKCLDDLIIIGNKAKDLVLDPQDL